METDTASTLILTICKIGEHLKVVQRELDAVEGVIADMVKAEDAQ